MVSPSPAHFCLRRAPCYAGMPTVHCQHFPAVPPPVRAKCLQRRTLLR